MDVVLLPIDLPTNVKGYAINEQEWSDILIRPAENVTIIGFPFGETAGGLFGVWQTGHIASEPDLNFSNLPALLVDSTAFPGNSGSPVIARRYGSWFHKDGNYNISTGFVTNFIGIYSGRLGKAELKFVWKRSVIDDILANK